MDIVKHQFAHVNGIRLHYVEAGQGDQLIVFLHGWPEFWYSWRHQIAFFYKDFHVVAPDMRGFNESDKPKKTSAYKSSVVAQDIVELIQFLGYKKAIVVGHDWGGAVTWSLLDNHPKVIEKAFILNCPEPKTMINYLRKNPSQMLKSWYIFLFQIPWLPEILMKLALRQIYEKEVRNRAFNKSAFDDDDLERYVEAMNKKGAIAATLNYYRAGMLMVFPDRKSTEDEEHSVSDPLEYPPVHLIWGEEDHVLSKPMILETKKELGRGATLDLIPNCSHWVQNDAAVRVNKIIARYL